MGKDYEEALKEIICILVSCIEESAMILSIHKYYFYFVSLLEIMLPCTD